MKFLSSYWKLTKKYFFRGVKYLKFISRVSVSSFVVLDTILYTTILLFIRLLKFFYKQIVSQIKARLIDKREYLLLLTKQKIKRSFKRFLNYNYFFPTYALSFWTLYISVYSYVIVSIISYILPVRIHLGSKMHNNSFMLATINEIECFLQNSLYFYEHSLNNISSYTKSYFILTNNKMLHTNNTVPHEVPSPTLYDFFLRTKFSSSGFTNSLFSVAESKNTIQTIATSEYLFGFGKVFIFLMVLGLISFIIMCLLVSLEYSRIAISTNSKRAHERSKRSAYECGFEPFEDARNSFDVNFYLVALLFILFDLEIVFLLPWSVFSYYCNFFEYKMLFIFLYLLTLGFIYEWKKGALEWY